MSLKKKIKKRRKRDERGHWWIYFLHTVNGVQESIVVFEILATSINTPDK